MIRKVSKNHLLSVALPSNCLYCSPFMNRFRDTVAMPTVLLTSHVYTPLLLPTTGLMVRTDPLTPSVTTTLPFRNV